MRNTAGVVFAATSLLLPIAISAQAPPTRTAGQGSAPAHIQVSVNEGTSLSADISPDGRSIVFDLLGQLWLMPAAGGAAQALTDAVADTADEFNPLFSPDGRSVAFAGERAGRRGLWLFDLESRRVRQLYQLPDAESLAGEPDWSPDGLRLVFSRTLPGDSAGPPHLALLDVRSGAVRRLDVSGFDSVALRDPAWSPDGERIAFVAQARTGAQLWTVPSQGGAPTALTGSLPGRIRAVSFARDGRRIAFLADDSPGRPQLWVQGIESESGAGAPRQLTSRSNVAATEVRWARDGTLLYSADGGLRRIQADGDGDAAIPFAATVSLSRTRHALPAVRFPEAGEEQRARGFMGLALAPDARRYALLALGRLWVVGVEGEARSVASVPHTARHVAWSPDGAEVAWSAGAPGSDDLFATEIATGVTRQVTALSGRELHPVYSPDGRWIAFDHADSVTRLRLIPAKAATVRHVAETRDLTEAEVGWTGSNVVTPLWSPDGDALLQTSDWESDSPARGRLVRMDGAHSSVAIPDAANYPQWTRSGLVWTRHDRLWRASFDATRGFTGSATALGDAPAMYVSAAPDGTVLFVSEDGLRLRDPSGVERSLGWPVRFTPPVPGRLLIRGARIVDGTGPAATEPRDILIERGRIQRIAAAGSIAADGAQVLDAAGRFAIPGLMELHAHTYLPELLPGFLYFGVTLIRDQGASIAPLVAYADAIAAGVVPGPRVSYGAFQYYSDWAFDEEQGRGIEPEQDPAHVGRAVALAAAFGAQHVKIRTFRRWDINARIVAEAHRRGLRATGHCAQQLPLIAAGMDSKEHSGACGPRFGRELLYDDAIQLLRNAGIGVVPTISYLAFAANMNARPDMLDGDEELAPFMAPRSSFGWMLQLTPAQRESWARDALEARATTVRLARAGVVIGTGSDIWQIPIGAHLEMEEMVAAGLSPAEVIRAATLGSATIVGVERDLGTVEVGKLADLVLLEADPLTDIRNTRKIVAVVKGGQIVDRAAIREQFARR